PFADTRFARINLLAAADKADNNGPILMPIEAADEELRLRLIEVWSLLSLKHELTRLVEIPCSLCFIKQRDMFNRCTARIDQTFIAKVVNILDERLHLTSRLTPLHL